MSYAHTKRRKNIKRWKKQLPHAWRRMLAEIGKSVRAKNDGPCIGTLQNILTANK